MISWRRRNRDNFFTSELQNLTSNIGMLASEGSRSSLEQFEQIVLPHLNAAYNLARWLVRNPHDAEDIVQEAYLRAFRFWSGFEGGDPRAWLLKIVRNTSYSFLEKNHPAELTEEFDEKLHLVNTDQPSAEAALVQSAESKMLRDALERLPVNFREAVILRELEGLSYREIASVMDVPIGSVMSSLARGRAMLRKSLLSAREREIQSGL